MERTRIAWIYTQAGIYRIKVLRPDLPPKYYLGQNVKFKRRRKSHFIGLRKGKHKNYALQSDFIKYGEKAVLFEVLIVCNRQKDILDFYEQSFLDSYEISELYNICLESVGSRTGVKSRPETCVKIGKGNSGKVRTQEHKDAVGNSNRNRDVSDETRVLMSIAHTGKRFPGRVLSEPHKAAVGDFF